MDDVPNLNQEESFNSLPETNRNNRPSKYKGGADEHMFNIEENENETTNNFAIVDLKRSPTKTNKSRRSTVMNW